MTRQNKPSLEEAGEILASESRFTIQKSCALCKHFRVCGIRPMFAGGIVNNFPDVIESNDLAYICKAYDAEDSYPDVPQTDFPKKAINSAFRNH